MKKFKFSLNTVHKYKNQILDILKDEHSQILAAIVNQSTVIKNLELQRKDLNEEFNEKNKTGTTILEVTNYKRYLKILEYKIKEEYDIMDKLKEEELAKREEVIEAKKSTATFDILKEKKLEEYNKALQKSEELLIDEFVSNKLFVEKNR